MREKIILKSSFPILIEPVSGGARLRIGGIAIADLQASASVVTQYQTLFNGLNLNADGVGDLLEALAAHAFVSKSGWNDSTSGAVDPVKEVEKVNELASEGNAEPTLLARATEKFKGAFDWMMG